MSVSTINKYALVQGIIFLCLGSTESHIYVHKANSKINMYPNDEQHFCNSCNYYYQESKNKYWVYLYNGILYRNENEQTTASCKHMDISHKLNDEY